MKRSAWLMMAVVIGAAHGGRAARAQEVKPPAAITMSVKYQAKSVDGAADVIGALAKVVANEIHANLGSLMGQEEYNTTTGADFLKVDLKGPQKDSSTTLQEARKQLRAAAYKVATDHQDVKVADFSVSGSDAPPK